MAACRNRGISFSFEVVYSVLFLGIAHFGSRGPGGMVAWVGRESAGEMSLLGVL